MFAVFPTLFFEELLEELLHLRSSLIQCPFPGLRGVVDLAAPAVNARRLRSQPPALFQTMKQRIHGSGPNFITMPPQLVHHPQTEDSFRARVMQYMDTDEARENFGISSYSFCFRQALLPVVQHQSF
jgi:hypothetical protein